MTIDEMSKELWLMFKGYICGGHDQLGLGSQLSIEKQFMVALDEIIQETKGQEKDRIANKILDQPWDNAIPFHEAIIRDEWDV